MDIAAGILTLRPNSANYSPKPTEPDLHLLTQHLQTLDLPTHHPQQTFQALVGRTIADMLRRNDPSVTAHAQILLRQTVNAARLSWLIDRTGAAPRVRCSAPLLSSGGQWYRDKHTLTLRDLTRHDQQHTTAYLTHTYPEHPADRPELWTGLEGTLYAAPTPIILPPHIRVILTDRRAPGQPDAPILWDSQVPAGHVQPTAVRLSPSDAPLWELAVICDHPTKLRSVTYLSTHHLTPGRWTLHWQSTQALQPDGSGRGAETLTHLSPPPTSHWSSEQVRFLALALSAAPREHLPCTHRSGPHWPTATYPLFPAAHPTPA